MIQKINIAASEDRSFAFQKTALFILCILIPLFVGQISSGITSENFSTLEQLNKPPLYPPRILFPIVWTILYILMGIASYFVLTANTMSSDIVDALSAYALQLGVNFFWPIFFFNLQAYWFSFVWILLLWVLVGLTVYNFAQVSKKAAWLMLPYFIWVTFAAYLNLGVAILN